MELAAIEGAQPDGSKALKAFTDLAGQPFNPIVGLAGIARSTMLFKQSEPLAQAAMTATLDEWVRSQRSLRIGKPANDVTADVAAIRKIIFKPTGGFAPLATGSWNAFSFPTTLSYVVLNPDITVTTSDGVTRRVTVYQDLPDVPRTVFMTTEDIDLAERLIITLGGTQRRAPTQIMETPNQPAGHAVDVMKFWNGFFPTRQGHWGGWVLETYPIINRIEFLDAARTKASVLVEVGYSGATVVMEKKNGVWQAIRLVNQWIT